MLTHVELSRKGGEAVLRKHGPDHFREIGRKGGRASGQVRRGEPTVTRTLRVSEQTAAALDLLAARRGVTLSTLVLQAVVSLIRQEAAR